jgi:hypothetical protein
MADHSPQLAAALVARCFHARTLAHLMHLRTSSFAVHMALQGFYEEIVPLTDTFAETYQGLYGLLTDYPDELPGADAPLPMLKDLRGWMQDNRKAIAPDSHLQNIIDELIALIDQTTYKVRFLK